MGIGSLSSFLFSSTSQEVWIVFCRPRRPAHVLPYWENVAIEDAVDYVFLRIAQLKARFPDKPAILTEAGWPSGGGNRGKSVASPENQARFMKELTTRAKAEGDRTQAEDLDRLVFTTERTFNLQAAKFMR